MAFGVIASNQESPHEIFQRDLDPVKVLDTCIRKDGNRYYKIQWNETWEREDCLVACDRLVKEFWNGILQAKHNVLLKRKNGFIDNSEDIESNREFKSPSPPVTSGRRKGRPKKLVNHTVAGHDINEIKENIYEEQENKRDINDNLKASPKNDVENHDLRVEIPQTNGHNVDVEEYPVMIIRENEAADGHQVHSPCSSNDSANMHTNDESSYKKPRYCNEIPRISNIKSMIPNKDLNPPRIKYTSSMIKSDDYNYNSKISPVYVSSHQYQSIAPAPNSYSVIKPRDGYIVSEGVPIVYETRPIHTSRINGNIHYMVAEPNHTVKIENRSTVLNEPLRLSPDRKIEASKLLLKVTAPGQTVSTTYISPSHGVSQQFPVYQSNPVVTTIKHTKDNPKLKTNIIHKTVDGEQRPQCSECFQTFKKRAALERHMMIHRGIKPFQCHFCNQRFRQKHHLQGHIMLHTGERPHSCTLCNKKFRMRHHLLEHERISHKVFR